MIGLNISIKRLLISNYLFKDINRQIDVNKDWPIASFVLS